MNKSATAACNTDAKTVQTAVGAYYVQNGQWPVASSTWGSADPLTSSTKGGPYLHSFPSSPYYVISIGASGEVDVALTSRDSGYALTPGAESYDTDNVCGQIAGSASSPSNQTVAFTSANPSPVTITQPLGSAGNPYASSGSSAKLTAATGPTMGYYETVGSNENSFEFGPPGALVTYIEPLCTAPFCRLNSLQSVEAEINEAYSPDDGNTFSRVAWAWDNGSVIEVTAMTAGSSYDGYEFENTSDPGLSTLGISPGQALECGGLGSGESCSAPPATTYTPTATATSGLAPVFTIDGPSASVCSISSGVVSFTGIGTCTIDADQPGNSSWNAAPQAQQSITVS